MLCTHIGLIDLPFSLSDLDAMEYRPVRVRGKFLHNRELIMGPRSLITPNDEHKGGLFTQQDTSIGYLVITPFQLEDSKYNQTLNEVFAQHVKRKLFQQNRSNQSRMGAEKFR